MRRVYGVYRRYGHRRDETRLRDICIWGIWNAWVGLRVYKGLWDMSRDYDGLCRVMVFFFCTQQLVPFSSKVSVVSSPRSSFLSGVPPTWPYSQASFPLTSPPGAPPAPSHALVKRTRTVFDHHSRYTNAHQANIFDEIAWINGPQIGALGVHFDVRSCMTHYLVAGLR